MAAIYLTKILRIGGGTIKETPKVLKELNCSNPLLITDKFLHEKSGFVDIIKNAGLPDI